MWQKRWGMEWVDEHPTAHGSRESVSAAPYEIRSLRSRRRRSKSCMRSGPSLPHVPSLVPALRKPSGSSSPHCPPTHTLHANDTFIIHFSDLSLVVDSSASETKSQALSATVPYCPPRPLLSSCDFCRPFSWHKCILALRRDISPHVPPLRSYHHFSR